jgi:hypothetical protein
MMGQINMGKMDHVKVLPKLQKKMLRGCFLFTTWCVGFLVRFPSAMGLGKMTPVGSWCRFAAPARDFIMTQA